jgi:sulfhydrogenase subunit gamma (sulfur reductase)
MISPHLPQIARIVDRIQESDSIFSLHLRFADPARHADYRFRPGQFNMIYLPGAGEVPISLSSDPEDREGLAHTIRMAGRVTQGLARLRRGDEVGLRGPYGSGWPLETAEGKDVIIITGGLGCAPVVAVIHYVLKRRARFRRLIILQGVKHSHDLIWRSSYERWAQAPDTQVLIAANATEAIWPWHVGSPIDLVSQAEFDPDQAVAMICGPEGMMVAAARELAARGLPEAGIHVSLERNMQCALGLCGHCQLGGKFLCRDGPVFAYPEVKFLLESGGL